MRDSVHFYHTPVLALECGYTPGDAIDLATFDQLTDWATPKNLGPDYWPDATGFKPRETQVDEVYGALSVLDKDEWNSGWDVCGMYHFPDQAEYDLALWALGDVEHDLPDQGRLVHTIQDIASHRGYVAYPSEGNRNRGTSRYWPMRIAKRVVRGNELLGHWLRPEVDDLTVSRDAIVAVSVDLRRALWRRPDPPTETSEAIGLLMTAKDDKDLVKLCKAYWLKHTGRAMPDFKAPGPQSEMWRRWCA